MENKWVIVAISFLMVFTCLGFCSSNKGRYLGPITEALDIRRSLFSINDTFRFGISALINFFFGALVVKFGIRRLVAFGFTTLIGAVLIYANATNIFVFYIGGSLLGTGLAFTTTAVASVLIKRWFTGKTGTVLGYALGSIVVNILYDLCGGTYFYAMLLFAGILLAVTVMYQFIITSAHKVCKQVEAEV